VNGCLTVGDIATLTRGKTYKGMLVGKPGVALLGLGSIVPGGGFKASGYKTYGGDCPEDLTLYPGDIYVSLKGATKDGEMIGSVARVPPEVLKGRLTQDTVCLRFKRPDPEFRDFVYWVLRTPQYRQYCANRATGSAVVGMSRDDFLSFTLPSMSDGNLVATRIFESIEAKIELNRKTNETLEAMAKVIFKSWFVDFDPVRAKAEDRPTGLPAEISDLFPDSFEDSELGEIPSGWKVDSIYSVASVTYGAPFSSSLFNGEGNGTPVARIRDLPGESPGVFTTEVHPKGILISSGDIVVGMDGEFRAYLWGGEECWMNQRVCKFIPGKKGRTCFLRESIRKPLMDVEMSETATTVIHIGKGDIDGFRVVVPTQEILDVFSAATTPLYEEVVANKQQTRVLANIRDALLPKLISGEIRIPDAEKMLEEVGI
jgi:type I restriction enzyme, S subunit